MPKESLQNVMGVMAGVYHKQGKISKEEAQQMSGLKGAEFDSVMDKAARIVEKVEKYDTVEAKYDKFAEHLYEEISEYIKKVGVFGI